jgi:glycosyltransferase involved in cell wall biosynthesis
MNILFYSHSWFPFINGITYRYQQIIDVLLKQNHNIILVTPYENAIDYKGITTIKISGTKIPQLFLLNNDDTRKCRIADYTQYHNLYFEITDICNQYNIDIIHCSGPDPFHAMLKIVSLTLHIPLVVMFHTNLSHYGKTFTKSALFTEILFNLPQKLTSCLFIPDLCVYPSKTYYNDMLKNGIINKTDSVYILPICVNGNTFFPSTKTKTIEWKENKIKLLYVGRVEVEKNINCIIKMMDENMSLCILGEGNDIQRLQILSKECNVDVRFIGQIKNTELKEWYSSTDIFIMPSKTETLGFVTLEAMACGAIVCGFNKGGTIDIIKHKQNGFLFHNKKSLRKCINTIHTNPKLAQQIVKNGLKFVKNKTIENSVLGLYNEYTKLVKGYKNKPMKCISER